MSLTDSEIKSAIKKILKKSPDTTLTQLIGELAKELEYEESELADEKKRIKSLLTEVIEADSEKPEKVSFTSLISMTYMKQDKKPTKGKRKAQPKKKKDSDDEDEDSDEKPKKKKKEGNVKDFVVESESDKEEKSSGSDSEEVVAKKPKKGGSKKKEEDESTSKEVKQLKSICRRAFITYSISVFS